MFFLNPTILRVGTRRCDLIWDIVQHSRIYSGSSGSGSGQRAVAAAAAAAADSGQRSAAAAAVARILIDRTF